MPDKAGVLAWEELWVKRAGIAAIAGSLLAMLGFVLLQTAIGGDTNFEGLLEAHEKSGQIWLSGIATCIGYVLLAGPLYFLFRAVRVRSDRVRGQLIGLAIAGPILIGASGLMLAASTQEAADSYIGRDAKSTLSPKEAATECEEDRQDEGAKDFAEEFDGGPTPNAACVVQKLKEDRASNAIRDAGFFTVAGIAGLAGGLTLIVALFYTGLWSMRTGLLSRFWGSLGMAVGVAALIGLTPLALVWFFYLGLLLYGILPRGMPPAWGAGEAVPWETPGEKAAADLESPPGELGEPAADTGAEPDSADPGEPRKKRKQRD